MAAAMALSMLAYTIAWRWANKRGQRREAERIESLRASGWLKEKQEEADDDRLEDKAEVAT